jgi:outer membrane protein
MALLLCAAGMGSALAQAPAPAVLAPAPGVPQSALPSLTASAATGQNLSELVAKARGYDAQWQAQQADAQAAASRAEQARSGLLPSVGLQAGANTSHVEVSVLPGSFRSPQQNLQPSSRCTARPTRSPTTRASAAWTWRAPSWTAASRTCW